MKWGEFAASAPEMAEFGRGEFERYRVALIETIRRDGSPRISNIEPCILDGDLYLGMMWQSRKALDLQRDARIALRNCTCTSTGDERELTVRGRAVEIHDADLRTRYLDEVADKIGWKAPHFHLFELEVESACLVQYGHGLQSVELWPQGTKFERPYG